MKRKISILGSTGSIGRQALEVIDKLNDKAVDVLAIDALSLAVEAGTVKAVNIVLIGSFAKNTDIAKEIWIEAIKDLWFDETFL